MSLLLTYPQAGKDVSQLHDALIAAGLVPLLVQSGDEVTFTPNPPGPDVETRTPTIYLTMPDGTVTGDVDALVAGSVAQARYDPATQLARTAGTREVARRQADLVRLQAVFNAVSGLADVPYAGAELIKLLRSLYRDLGLL